MQSPPARPFRFGILAKRARPHAEWIRFVRGVEDAGYATLLISDHMRPQFSPFAALAQAAAATSRLRLGTLVANNDFRHPVLLAHEAATADLLSDGRFELGLGAGWMRRDYTETGIPFDRGMVRAERFSEAVQLVRLLLSTEEPVTFNGTWYQVAGLNGGPLPVQKPLPLLIGAGGARMLETAAQTADIVSIGRSMKAGPDWAAGVRDGLANSTELKIEKLRAASGDRWSQLELNIVLTACFIGGGAHHEIDRLASEHGLSRQLIRDTPQHLLARSVSEAIDLVTARRDRFGLSYFVVGEDHVSDFLPVAAALSGR